jgi:hypothetical protein
MNNTSYSIIKCFPEKKTSKLIDVESTVAQFAQTFEPKENNLYVFSDSRTGVL